MVTGNSDGVVVDGDRDGSEVGDLVGDSTGLLVGISKSSASFGSGRIQKSVRLSSSSPSRQPGTASLLSL